MRRSPSAIPQANRFIELQSSILQQRNARFPNEGLRTLVVSQNTQRRFWWRRLTYRMIRIFRDGSNGPSLADSANVVAVRTAKSSPSSRLALLSLSVGGLAGTRDESHWRGFALGTALDNFRLLI